MKKFPGSRQRRGISALLMICALVGCHSSTDKPCPGVTYPARNGASVTIHQGIWGDVWFWDGNFMPPCGDGTVTAVQREVRIYELTTIALCDTFMGNGFFRGPHAQLIAATHSDSRGFFEIPLDTGRYSLCVVEDSSLYANCFGGQGEIYPVEVLPDSVTATRFDITYRAVE